MLALPRYHHVPNIILKRKGQSHFLWCDCGYYDRIGIPCAYIFQVVREMSLKIFHIRHWRYCNAYYNDSIDLGQQIDQAQMEHFAHEGMRVCLLLHQLVELSDGVDDSTRSNEDENILISSNTTSNDWTEAKFVLEKCIAGCCLWSELDNFILGDGTLLASTRIDFSPFEGYRDSAGFTSHEEEYISTLNSI